MSKPSSQTGKRLWLRVAAQQSQEQNDLGPWLFLLFILTVREQSVNSLELSNNGQEIARIGERPAGPASFERRFAALIEPPRPNLAYAFAVGGLLPYVFLGWRPDMPE